MQWVLALPTKASLHVISEIWLLLQCAVVLQRADADLRHQLTTSIFFLLGGGVVRLTAKPRYLLLLHRGKEKSNTVTALVPSSRTVTKTWRVNSADHWMAGENRHYCVTELATRDPPLPLYPLDLNQHSQRRIGRNFCLNKRTFLHQPQNSSVVVCWGSTDVLLVDSRGADPVRAWWRDAEGKALCITLLLNLLYFQSMFSVYIFTSVSVFCFN